MKKWTDARIAREEAQWARELQKFNVLFRKAREQERIDMRAKMRDKGKIYVKRHVVEAYFRSVSKKTKKSKARSRGRALLNSIAPNVLH